PTGAPSSATRPQVCPTRRRPRSTAPTPASTSTSMRWFRRTPTPNPSTRSTCPAWPVSPKKKRTTDHHTPPQHRFCPGPRRGKATLSPGAPPQRRTNRRGRRWLPLGAAALVTADTAARPARRRAFTVNGVHGAVALVATQPPTLLTPARDLRYRTTVGTLEQLHRPGLGFALGHGRWRPHLPHPFRFALQRRKQLQLGALGVFGFSLRVIDELPVHSGTQLPQRRPAQAQPKLLQGAAGVRPVGHARVAKPQRRP